MSEILRGLHDHEFVAYVQSKFELDGNAVHSVEVLARWDHPQRGLLAPAAFIPQMARESMLLDELICDLLDQGLACQTELHSQGRTLGFSFNISLLQLANDVLIGRLIARLGEHTLPLSLVTFEITEDAPSVASATCAQNVSRLRRLGVRMSLDDYGTGYSSLLRLCQLPFDELKLASQVTWHAIENRQFRSVIGNTVALAQELRMQLIVEGIETEGQRVWLKQMGVQLGQGYLHSRPMAAGSFGKWLQDHHCAIATRSSFNS
ncbi:MAG: EAL domain-containing protein [Comamonas sp.]|nr:EAL domain-containing protein [Comamonas sp.]